MKAIYEMSGIEKAATLMVALGPDAASRIMKYLDENSLNMLAEQIAKVENLNVKEKEDLIGEFLLGLKKNRGTVFGGENAARDILKSAFGDKKADEIFHKLSRKDLEKGFEFLKNIDSKILTNLLRDEHPQTITVTLSYLPPEKSADILQQLSTYVGKEIVRRMAKLDKTSPDAVLEIVRVLRNKYEKYMESGQQHESGGIDTLVDIMNQMSPEQENRIMNYFDSNLPLICDKIKDKLFTFDNVLNLTHDEIQILIDETRSDYLIAKALKGAGDEIRFKFLRNMSQNRATDILNEMDNMGPVRLTEIHEARNAIIDIMRTLNDNGLIALRKNKEQYVE